MDFLFDPNVWIDFTPEAFDAEILKGSIYAAMAFSLAVEPPNIRARAKRRAHADA